MGEMYWCRTEGEKGGWNAGATIYGDHETLVPWLIVKRFSRSISHAHSVRNKFEIKRSGIVVEEVVVSKSGDDTLGLDKYGRSVFETA